MASVEVQSETESAAGWVFRVLVHGAGVPSADPGAAGGRDGADPAGSTTTHDVALSWVDYEYWSRGRIAPEHVARAVVECLLEAGWVRLPPRFDAATGRRWVAHLDDLVRARL